MRFLTFAASIVLVAGLAQAASAASTNTLQVAIDQSTRLSIPGSAASVLVGNPALADVTVVDSQTLYISGRGYGVTDVVVLDSYGRPLYEGQIIVSADPANIAVYRGAARTDFACAPGCQVTTRSPNAASAGGSTSGSSSSSPGGSSAGAGAGGLAGVAQALAQTGGGGAGGASGGSNSGGSSGERSSPPS